MTSASEKTWIVYTLVDPQEGGIRYVGVTHQTLKRRLALHLLRAREESNKRAEGWTQTYSAETRAKMGAGSRGKKKSPETRAKMSISAKANRALRKAEAR